jgi:hypothetical protein
VLAGTWQPIFEERLEPVAELHPHDREPRGFGQRPHRQDVAGKTRKDRWPFGGDESELDDVAGTRFGRWRQRDGGNAAAGTGEAGTKGDASGPRQDSTARHSWHG